MFINMLPAGPNFPVAKYMTNHIIFYIILNQTLEELWRLWVVSGASNKVGQRSHSNIHCKPGFKKSIAFCAFPRAR